MSRTRSETVAAAATILKNFEVLADLCVELGKIDDLDNALAKLQKRHDEALALVARIPELKDAIQQLEAQKLTLDKQIAKLRGAAKGIAAQ